VQVVQPIFLYTVPKIFTIFISTSFFIIFGHLLLGALFSSNSYHLSPKLSKPSCLIFSYDMSKNYFKHLYSYLCVFTTRRLTFPELFIVLYFFPQVYYVYFKVLLEITISVTIFVVCCRCFSCALTFCCAYQNEITVPSNYYNL